MHARYVVSNFSTDPRQLYYPEIYIYENLGDSSTIFSSKSEEHARTCFAIAAGRFGKGGKNGKRNGERRLDTD